MEKTGLSSSSSRGNEPAPEIKLENAKKKLKIWSERAEKAATEDEKEDYEKVEAFWRNERDTLEAQVKGEGILSAHTLSFRLTLANEKERKKATGDGTQLEVLQKELESLREELRDTKKTLAIWSGLVLKAVSEEEPSEKRQTYERQQGICLQRITTLEAQIQRMDSRIVSQSLASAGSSLNPSNRLRMIESTHHGLSGFLFRVLLERDIDWNQPIVRLGEALWGTEERQQFLLSRNVERATEIAERFDAKHRKYVSPMHTIIAGTKGIGKSCFGLVVLAKIVKSGRLATLEMRQKKYLIISPEAWNNQTKYLNERTNRQTLDTLCTRERLPLIQEPGLYLVDKNVYDDLHSFLHIVGFIDVGDEPGSILPDAGPFIIVSSPNSERLKRFGELYPYRRELLPTWTKNEITHLNELLRDPAHSGTMVRPRTDNELNDFFALFGGVPHEIFKYKTFDEALHKVKDEIKEIPIELWRSVLGNVDLTRMPKFVPGIFVHILPKPGSEIFIRVVFASRLMASLVLENFHHEQRLALCTLIDVADSGECMRG